jgi:thiamine biosynthesis lipoprotein
MQPYKKHSRSRFYAACCIVLVATFISGCDSPRDTVYKEQLFVFGTIVEISIWGEQPQKAKQATAELAEDFQFLHRVWGPRSRGSLGRMNKLFPSKLAFTGSPSVLPMLVKARELSDQSNKLFNPAIGKLIQLWDFNQESKNQLNKNQLNKAPRELPDPEAIADLLSQNPTMDNLHLEGISIRSDNTALVLDFGAIAKGYGINLAIDKLREMGINNAIINAGGDLRAIGKHGDRNWHVGIRHPRQQGMIASLEVIKDESIFTSGDYERFFEYQGKRYHHILDPRTGYPAEGVVSVTVIDHDAAVADAAATALFIAGPEQWYEIAKSMGLKWVMLIDKDMKIHMNPAMAKRIKFELDELSDIKLSPPL